MEQGRLSSSINVGCERVCTPSTRNKAVQIPDERSGKCAHPFEFLARFPATFLNYIMRAQFPILCSITARREVRENFLAPLARHINYTGNLFEQIAAHTYKIRGNISYTHAATINKMKIAHRAVYCVGRLKKFR